MQNMINDIGDNIFMVIKDSTICEVERIEFMNEM